MQFRWGGSSSQVPIGCGSLLALFGLALLTPFGIFLVKAAGWISLTVGLILVVSGIYAWAIKFRRRHY